MRESETSKRKMIRNGLPTNSKAKELLLQKQSKVFAFSGLHPYNNEKEFADQTMKLYHRSDFWGNLIKPRPDKENEVQRPAIWVQAIGKNAKGQWCGCCRNEGKRVVEIKEIHFLDASYEQWNLYHVSSRYGKNIDVVLNKFVLIPKTHEASYIDPLTYYSTWTYVGSIQSCMARIELDTLLFPFFKDNKLCRHTGFLRHVHIGIFMDSVKIDIPKRRTKSKLIRFKEVDESFGSSKEQKRHQA